MNPWVVIYAIGAAQAALLALALWWRPANRIANRTLAAWLAIVALDLAVKALYLVDSAPGLFKAYRFVALFPFLYGSLFYLYVRALTTERGFGARDLVHLAGFALALALALAAGSWAPPGPWHDVFLFGYSLSYVVAALVRLQRYRQRLRQRRSDVDRMSLRWIEAMAIAQIVIWCIAATHGLIQMPGVDYFLIYGAVAAWVCVVGWFSLGQPPVAGDPVPGDAEPQPVPGAASAAAEDPRFPEVEARLSQLMADEALYREPALTIGHVARRSGYPEYLVSAAISGSTSTASGSRPRAPAWPTPSTPAPSSRSPTPAASPPSRPSTPRSSARWAGRRAATGNCTPPVRRRGRPHAEAPRPILSRRRRRARIAGQRSSTSQTARLNVQLSQAETM